MPGSRAARGAFRKDAPFFVYVVLAVLFGLPIPGLCAEPCPAARIDAHARSAYVYDGDTFRTESGEKVRIIGVNTPELGKDGRPDEPLAADAHALLRSLVREPLALQYGAERRDRYGRLLAHVFLPNGTNVATTLLERGLATTLHVPPNLGNSTCYRRVEQEARDLRRGLWALPGYRIQRSETLQARDTGYRLVEGRVEVVKPTRKSVWLELAGPLSVRIPRADLPLFGEPPDGLLGRTVLARGWIHRDGKRLRMTVRHPFDLETVP